MMECKLIAHPTWQMYSKKLIGINTLSCNERSMRLRPEWPWRARRWRISCPDESVQYGYLCLFPPPPAMLFFHLLSDQWWQYKKWVWRLSWILQNSIAPSSSQGKLPWRRRRALLELFRITRITLHCPFHESSLSNRHWMVILLQIGLKCFSMRMTLDLLHEFANTEVFCLFHNCMWQSRHSEVNVYFLALCEQIDGLSSSNKSHRSYLVCVYVFVCDFVLI